MPSKTRSEYIAILKTRGKRGKLSKMRKADLKRLVEESEPPMRPDSGRDENETDQHGSGAHTKHGSGLTLDPDPRAQGGGHYFQSFGETAASEKRKYKHEHEKSSMPTRNKQRGSGKHDYRDFVAAKMRQNGGNMKAAVAEWREQSGGHMVRTDGGGCGEGRDARGPPKVAATAHARQ